MQTRPNILFVLADQLGARWLPLYGHALVESPALEAFAQHSTVFERALTTSPICTPYRGCLLSGRYPSQTGLSENGGAYPSDLPSLADHLGEAGYASYYLGKWHLSGAPQGNRWVPPGMRAGFQHFSGWESHHVDHYAGLMWEDDPKTPLSMPGHETDSLTAVAEQKLAQAASNDVPFFMLISYQAPHPPCSPPAAFAAPYADAELLPEANADSDAWFKHDAWGADYDVCQFRQRYFGEISQLDAAFGRLLAALRRLKLADNTLVVFTSDHGEMAGAHGLFGKGLMYEEAIHVPLIIRAPGQKAGRRVAAPAGTIDLLPTLLDYAGADADADADARSLRPAVAGISPPRERIVISEYHNLCASTSTWKLVAERGSLRGEALYNIVADPYELENRLNQPDCAEIREALTSALARWQRRIAASHNEKTHSIRANA